MPKLMIALGIVGALIATDAKAIVQDQGVTMIGIGLETCESWAAHRPGQNVWNPRIEWVLGFASAVGWLDPKLDPLFGMYDTDVDNAIANICRIYPTETIADAADRMTRLHIKDEKAREVGELGAGLESCEIWTIHQPSPGDHGPELQWVLGFASGVGMIDDHRNPLAGLSYEDVDNWIGNYCLAHQKDNVDAAAKNMIRLHPR